jgi:hypothetical protein
MRKFLSLLLSLSLLLTVVGPAASQSTYAPYVWESLWVIPNAGPSAAEQDVRAELADEVTKFLDWANYPAGGSCPGNMKPPGPYYMTFGYIAENFYWLNTGESVLALSETLDFLSPPLRNRLIGYLKCVMTNSAISPLSYSIADRVAHPLMNKTNYRNLYAALPDELARGYIDSSRVDVITPPAENLYAAWAFAHYVSRYEDGSQTAAWTIINDRWANITTLYNKLPATAAIYWDVMGYVGYARMAKRLGKSYTQAEGRALAGYSSGVNYVQYYKTMKTSRWCEGNGNDQPWVGVWDYCGFVAIEPYSIYQETPPFQHSGYAGQVLNNRPAMFAAEVGRFLRDRAQNTVLNDAGYGINRWLSTSGAQHYPFWWETRGDKQWGLRDGGTAEPGNGENSIMHPSFAWQMFMLKAYVEGAGLSQGRAPEMHRYLDTPWAIGDPFHLQKLVTVLRMYSTVIWSEAGGTVMSVTPLTPKQGATVTITFAVVGTGQPTTVTDPLPAGLNYAGASTTCPGSVSGTQTVTYSGTPTAGSSCTITIQATVTTSQRIAVTNAATVTDGGPNSPYVLSTVLILNPANIYLPIVRR